jgi:uncharacterized membrane protein AbrB (regulator of aidB expression)
VVGVKLQEGLLHQLQSQQQQVVTLCQAWGVGLKLQEGLLRQRHRILLKSLLLDLLLIVVMGTLPSNSEML